MTPGARARSGLALAAAALVLLLTADPAAADPPRPTDYRSTITDVAPALPSGVELRIIGGDSLLELSVAEGHTAAVADYPTSDDAEPVPYLRFEADGTVRRNALAVATTANDRRFGSSTTVPDPDAAPRWEVVAGDGTYAWHDHRIHWMSPKAPRNVGPDGVVDLGGADGTWSVPITVDDRPTVVTGELVLEPRPSAAGWLPAIAVVFGVTALVGRRFGARAAAVIALLAGAGATVAALATARAVPPEAGGSTVPVVVALVAVAAALVALFGPVRARPAGQAAAAAALLGWAATRWTVLTRAVLPTTLAPGLDRLATAVALGVGAAVVLLLVRPPDTPGATDA